MTEDEAEAMQARSDLLNDRVQARLAREGAENYPRILQEEIERLNRERPLPLPTPEQVAAQEAWLEAFNRGETPSADEDEEPLCVEHPVAVRAQEIWARWQEQADAEDWVPDGALAEHPTRELLAAMRRAHVKLAAWLDHQPWPPRRDLCALTLVRLKKSREYLEDTLRALESCQDEQLLTPTQLAALFVDVGELIRRVDELIAELRMRLEPETD